MTIKFCETYKKVRKIEAMLDKFKRRKGGNKNNIEKIRKIVREITAGRIEFNYLKEQENV